MQLDIDRLLVARKRVWAGTTPTMSHSHHMSSSSSSIFDWWVNTSLGAMICLIWHGALILPCGSLLITVTWADLSVSCNVTCNWFTLHVGRHQYRCQHSIRWHTYVTGLLHVVRQPQGSTTSHRVPLSMQHKHSAPFTMCLCVYRLSVRAWRSR